MGYLSDGWMYRWTLTVDRTKVAADVSAAILKFNQHNLPADLFTLAKSDGADIRFSDDTSGATPLKQDLVYWTGASSQGCFYVAVSNLLTSADRVLYVWAGKPDAAALAAGDTYGRNACWQSVSSMICQHHFQESSGTLYNSTGDATYDGTGSGITYAQDAGDGQNCIYFNSASNANVTLGGKAMVEANARYFCGWVWDDNTSNSNRSRIVSEENSGTGVAFARYNNSGVDNRLYFKSSDSDLITPSNSFPLDSWKHIAITWPAGTGAKTFKIYVDGALSTSGSRDPAAAGSQNTTYGKRTGATDRNYGGYMQDCRWESVEQSADNILTLFRNESSPGTFSSASAVTMLLSNDHTMGRGIMRGVGRGIM